VVHLEDRGACQLRHPPRPRVETGTEHHELRRTVLADGVVDHDGARHHGLPGPPDHLPGHPVGSGLRSLVAPDGVDELELSAVQQLAGDRVGEATDGVPPVRDRPPLADEDGSGTGSTIAHRTSLAAALAPRTA
jgi:hypothetical protein